MERAFGTNPGETKKHHAAMAYQELSAFISVLRAQASIPATALVFLILTAARAGEVLGARWDEIDLEAKVWTVPALRMKNGREHRVPLSDAALAILRQAAEWRTGELIFPGRGKRPMVGGTLAYLLPAGCTTHGFRSSFSTFCAEKTEFSFEVAELALAHTMGSAVSKAYRRTDQLERRRELMAMWAEYYTNSSI